MRCAAPPVTDCKTDEKARKSGGGGRASPVQLVLKVTHSCTPLPRRGPGSFLFSEVANSRGEGREGSEAHVSPSSSGRLNTKVRFNGAAAAPHAFPMQICDGVCPPRSREESKGKLAVEEEEEEEEEDNGGGA